MHSLNPITVDTSHPARSWMSFRIRVGSAALLTVCLGTLLGCGHASSGTTAQANVAPANATTVAQAGAEMDTAAKAMDEIAAGDKTQSSTAPAQITPESDTCNDQAFKSDTALLSPADVKFYLTVMRAAAQRVSNPTPEDLAAIQKSNALDAAMSAAAKANEPRQTAISAVYAKYDGSLRDAMNRQDFAAIKSIQAQQNKELAAIGPLQDVPSLDAAAQQRADYLHGDVDKMIVHDRHLDACRYKHVSWLMDHQTESSFGVATCPAGQTCAFVRAGDAERFRKQKMADEQNAKLIAPWRAEIISLQTFVKQKTCHQNCGRGKS